MKLTLLALFFMLSRPVAAYADLKSYAIETSIPCIAAMIVGPMMDKTNGVKTGAAVCAGAAAYTTTKHFITKSTEVTDKDLADLKVLIKNMQVKQNQLAAKASQKSQDGVDDKTRSEIEELINKEVSRLSAESYERMKRIVNDPNFMPELVDRVNGRIRSEVLMELNAQRPGLVREIAEEVVLQVTARPVILKGQRVILPDIDDANRARVHEEKTEEVTPRPREKKLQEQEKEVQTKKRPKIYEDE